MRPNLTVKEHSGDLSDVAATKIANSSPHHLATQVVGNLLTHPIGYAARSPVTCFHRVHQLLKPGKNDNFFRVGKHTQ